MDASAHCEQLVRTADRDRYLATLFAPASHRGALFALYAFDAEVARVRDRVREPLAGAIRLQWWSEVLRGERAGEGAAHPVAAALLATMAGHKLAAVPLLDLVEARSFDLYDEPMAKMADLENYAVKTSSAVLAMAAAILGADAASVADLARHAGIAQALVGLLRALPLHVARRQLYVPLDLLQRRGIRPEDVWARKNSPEFKAALAELRDVAHSHLASFSGLTARLPRPAVAAFLPLAPTRPMLDRLDRADPFAPPQLAPWRRQWLIWRAARDPSRLAG